MSRDRVLHLDFETCGILNLKTHGLERTIDDPNFAVTVIAYAFDGGPVYVLPWPHTVTLPGVIVAHIAAGGTVAAWNAAFEWNVLTAYYMLDVSLEQMSCSMQKALAFGLPASLLKAGQAAGAAIVKDETMRKTMLSLGRARNAPGSGWWHVDADQGDRVALKKMADLMDYCEQDVKAERCLDAMLPPLHALEKRLSVLDAKINATGICVDVDAVTALMCAAQVEQKRLDAECDGLTGGEVSSPGTQTARMIGWLKDRHGIATDSVDKVSVKMLLDDHRVQGAARRVLEIRALAARSSVAKLQSMLDVASHDDNRARNLLQFYGAGRTGRWAGRLIQPQNLPRPAKGVKPDDVIACARVAPEHVGLLWPDPLDAIASSLRACFVAQRAPYLASVDLSQIEARVLAWLAGQADVLGAFSRGEDVYTLAAAKVGSKDRQLGKVLTLACGYGMGPAKFQDTAAGYGVTLTLAEAEATVWRWRETNASIVRYWKEVEAAVRRSIDSPGAVLALPRGMMVRTRHYKGMGMVTQVRKPNTVKLTWHDLRPVDGELHFSGVNGTTKAWGPEKTYGGKLVENIVQSVARDVMAEAMLKVYEDGGPLPVMTVHDEVVWEVPDGASAKALQLIVEMRPAWAAGLPLGADLRVAYRYGK